MEQLKIYADANIYARQFDDRTQMRINIEAYACSVFFNYVQTGEIVLIGSTMMKYEIHNTNTPKLFYVLPLLRFCQWILKYDERLYHLAKRLKAKTMVRPKDAMHLAFALTGKADYFVTCDDKLLKKANKIHDFFLKDYSHGLYIVNPVELIVKLAYAKNN